MQNPVLTLPQRSCDRLWRERTWCLRRKPLLMGIQLKLNRPVVDQRHVVEQGPEMSGNGTLAGGRFADERADVRKCGFRAGMTDRGTAPMTSRKITITASRMRSTKMRQALCRGS